MKLKQHPLGFWQLANMPSPAELAAYYREKYFSKKDGSTHYAYEYDSRDLAHKRIAPHETARTFNLPPGRLLEVGVGEGFALAHFHRLGWDVTGIDFDSQTVKAFHPEVAGKVREGDALSFLDECIERGERYDAVICSHVLEHVLNPTGLLDRIHGILSKDGAIRISLPNDGSWIQNLIVDKSYADSEYWVVEPDHINYFNVTSLRKTLAAHGFEIVDLLAEFPVDVFLMNRASNYWKHKERGRDAHWARVEFELALFDRGIDDLMAFRRTCANIGIGRALSAYAKRKS